MRIDKRYSFWKVFWIVLAVYLLFTLLGLLALFVSSQEQVTDSLLTWGSLLRHAVSLVFTSFFFYYTLNHFYLYFAERRHYVHYLRMGAVAGLACLAYNGGSYLLLQRGHVASAEVVTTGMLLFSFAFITLFYLGLSILVAYLTNLRDGQKQRKILEEQKMQLEVEKSQANLNFLKAQINPHFLHNTLNFLYARSLPYSAELSEGILTLSDIMRYALSEGNARDGKAPLKDEIEHVRNVIKINQLRFSNNLNVQFQVHGVVNGATIIPFVLITLVENAFKHGDLKSIDNPIDIQLRIDEKSLCFYCHNKKKTGPKEISTGVGLDNIRKRLELAYGSGYQLEIRDEMNFYTTELTINQL